MSLDAFPDPSEDDNFWAVPRGPSLLDPQDSDVLDSFFDNPENFNIAAQNTGTSQLATSHNLFADVEDWNQYLSPSNLQTPSNVGPLPSAISSATADAFQQTLPGFGIPAVSQPQPVTDSQDYDAALALLGANSQHPQPYTEDPFFASHHTTTRLPTHHTRHSISGPVPQQLTFGSTAPSALLPHLASGPNPPNDRHGPRPQVIRFGSDTSFHPSAGFVAPPNTDTHIEIQKRLVHDMNAMGRRESAPSTPASSPKLQRRRERSFPELKESDLESSLDAGSDEEEEARPQPKKRRKSTKLDIPSPPHLKTMSRRKSASQPKRRDRHSSSGDLGRGAKHKENLTEEQKRNNHIQSEQKRRNIIKDGYNDLNKLVPSLKEGGFSKSQALVESASFLDEIVAGNKRLREMLNANHLDD